MQNGKKLRVNEAWGVGDEGEVFREACLHVRENCEVCGRWEQDK